VLRTASTGQLRQPDMPEWFRLEMEAYINKGREAPRLEPLSARQFESWIMAECEFKNAKGEYSCTRAIHKFHWPRDDKGQLKVPDPWFCSLHDPAFNAFSSLSSSAAGAAAASGSSSSSSSSAAAAADASSAPSDDNDDLCGLCDQPGELVVCDLCPHAYHEICLHVHDARNRSLNLEHGHPFRCKDAHLRCVKRKPIQFLQQQDEEDEDEGEDEDEPMGIDSLGLPSKKKKGKTSTKKKRKGETPWDHNEKLARDRRRAADKAKEAEKQVEAYMREQDAARAAKAARAGLQEGVQEEPAVDGDGDLEIAAHTISALEAKTKAAAEADQEAARRLAEVARTAAEAEQAAARRLTKTPDDEQAMIDAMLHLRVRRNNKNRSRG